MYIVLESFHHRHGPALYADRIADVIRKRCQEEIEDAQVAVFGAPPVDGLGNASGFKLMVEDRTDAGLEMLQGQADNLAEKAGEIRGLVGVFNTFSATTPVPSARCAR